MVRCAMSTTWSTISVVRLDGPVSHSTTSVSHSATSVSRSATSVSRSATSSFAGAAGIVRTVVSRLGFTLVVACLLQGFGPTPVEGQNARAGVASQADPRLRPCADELGHPVTDHAVIAGRVIDDLVEEPVPGARIEARWMNQAVAVGDPRTAPGSSAESDRDGTFLFCEADPGLAAVWAVVDDRRTEVEAIPDLELGEVTDVEIRVVYHDPVDVYGRVRRLETGAPVSGVTVRLRSDDRSVTTDALGAFSFDEVPPGYHGVEVVDPDLGPLWEVVPVSGSGIAGLDVTLSDPITAEYPMEVGRLGQASRELGRRLEEARPVRDAELEAAARQAEDALDLIATLELPELERSDAAPDAPVEVYVDGWRAEDAAALLEALDPSRVAEVRVIGPVRPVPVADEPTRGEGGSVLLIRTR